MRPANYILASFAFLACFAFSSCAVDQPPPETQKTAQNIDLDDESLDSQFQIAAEQALARREGAVIVIDPQTGHLRAVVNSRLAFEQSFPPGSAIKPFTALTAMRAGLIDRDTSRQCAGRYSRDGLDIVCSHPKSNLPFDLPHALAYSCNDYFAHVGERLSEGTYNSTLNSFGFGARTGVNAAESAGKLSNGQWRVQDALGEGDHLLVTPIQLMRAYTALVNGGRLFRPQLAGSPGGQSPRIEIDPRQRAILIEGMRGAVKYGTAEKANLDDLPFFIFGKTGTSTSSNGFRRQGWFVGFVAEKNAAGVPRPDRIMIGVLVFLKRSHGSECAGVMREIIERWNAKHAEHANDAKEQITADDFHVFRPSSRVSSSLQSKSIRVKSVRENIIRDLPLEDYLAGVLTGESSIERELEALKAQAVMSRTFALKNLGRHANEGYDLCSTTHCQRFVYQNAKQTSIARRAVNSTEGEVLIDGVGNLVDGYFHAACGGMTANIETLWGVKPAPSYLRGVRDDFCSAMPHRHWVQTISAAQLSVALRKDERTDAGPNLRSIAIGKRDATGRAERMTIDGNSRKVVNGWDFKMIVGRNLGWQMIKSSRFDVSKSGDNFIFRGSGFGHGLGLCQEGAHVMAARGKTYREIIGHYFPGVMVGQTTAFMSAGERIKPGVERSGTPGTRHLLATELAKRATDADLHCLSPASQARHFFSTIPGVSLGLQNQTSEHFHLTAPMEMDRATIQSTIAILERAYTDMQRRLGQASLQLPASMKFEVIVHATTADFIAATGQSGWAAGVTRGRRIELQPPALLRKRGIFDATLRHELTHAFVEVLGNGLSPRWLSEGLAIYYAGEGERLNSIKPQTSMTRDEIERRFSRRLSQKEIKELYAVSYREVRKMIETEGESSVWLLVVKRKI